MRSPTYEQELEIQFLTVPELAKLSRESEAAWRKRVFFRQIPFVKVGRNVRVRREDFERWIQRRVVPAEGKQ
jgi:excisionase family DNA binding protein